MNCPQIAPMDTDLISHGGTEARRKGAEGISRIRNGMVGKGADVW